MKIQQYWSLIKVLPLHVVFKKTIALVIRETKNIFKSRIDKHQSSYQTFPGQQTQITNLFFGNIEANLLIPHVKEISYLSSKCLLHEFNLLGSKWVKVSYGLNCAGVEGSKYNHHQTVVRDNWGVWLHAHINSANIKKSTSIWKLIPEEYIPIDWQLDFKSGFRWDSQTPSKSIVYGNSPGADIKVPWELARMQHLPQLAWAYGLVAQENSQTSEISKYTLEFRNQILDFIATNPPRWGVNWVCNMDVAIRVSNWLVSYDLFKNFGATFDDEFESIFLNSIHDHGKHIINNLEWFPELRSNHYLSNIAGLIFVAAFLPSSTKTDAWLSFGIEQLTIEMDIQFQNDGSNFEASSSYHRLSAEMLIYTLLIIANLPEIRNKNLAPWSKNSLNHQGPGLLPPMLAETNSIDRLLNQKTLDVIEKIEQFTTMISMPDGNVAQIGDNDSGRFLKLQPCICAKTGQNDEYFESHLNHQHLIAICKGFLKKEHDNKAIFIEQSILFNMKPFKCVLALKPDAQINAMPNSFPDFGVYQISDNEIYAVVRCGSVGQHNNGGHAHNDQLSFTASFKGETFFIDPGTYLYTAHHESRNRFRSTAMHNTLSSSVCEQNSWLDGPLGLFSLSNITQSDTLLHEENKFEGLIENTNYHHRRTLLIEDAVLWGEDEFDLEDAILSFHLSPEVTILNSEGDPQIILKRNQTTIRLSVHKAEHKIVSSHCSLGYGEIEETNCIQFSKLQSPLKWQIEVISSNG